MSVRMVRVALYVYVLLAAVSQKMVVSTTFQKSPECQLNNADRKNLEEVLVKEDYSDALIVGSFVGLWSSQFIQKEDPLCMKTNIKRTQDPNILKRTISVEDVKNGSESTIETQLKKVDTNVYLVSKDGSPISRLYLVQGNINTVVLFECSVIPGEASRYLAHNLNNWWKNPKVQKSTDDIPMNKMAIIALRESSLTYPLNSSAQKSLDDAWSFVLAHQDVFGKAYETRECALSKKYYSNKVLSP